MSGNRVFAASGADLTSPVTAFLLVVCCAFLLCLVIGVRDVDDRSADFFAANRSWSAVRNAVAMGGDYVLVTALLVPVGSVALAGYDGMALVVCAVLGLGVLVLLAEPLRNTGRITPGGALEHRLPNDAVRIAGAVVSLAMCLPLTVIQLTVAGETTAYVLGQSGSGAAQICTALIGLLMISFAAFSGMRGTSVLAAGKAVVLVAAFAVTAIVVVRRFGWDMGTLLASAAQGSGRGEGFDQAGRLYGTSPAGRLEILSLCLGVGLGQGLLPAMLMRVSAARDGRSARRSVRYAVLGYALFCALTVVVGLGAAAIVGGRTIVADDQEGNSALFLLSGQLAGGRDGFLFTVISCAVFLTALGAVSALTLAASATLTRDVFMRTRRRSRGDDGREVRMARWMIMGFGVASVVLAVWVHGWSTLFLGTYALTVAASVMLPALVYSLFWNRFNRTGLLWTLYGGLACCTVLQLSGPTVSGDPTALFPNLDFQWFPLRNPAVVTLPIGFLLGWAASLAGRRTPADRAGDAHAEARRLTGVDAGELGRP